MEDNISIDGVSYDRKLLEAAVTFTQGKGEYRLSLEEIQTLYKMSHKGKSATELKIATLHYIARNYRLTEKAQKWYSEHFQPIENDFIESTIKKVLDEYDLFNLRLSIDSNIVREYESAGNGSDWEAVFRSAIEAYLEDSEGQLGLAKMVALREGTSDGYSVPKPLLKSYLDKGTLYLVPLKASGEDIMPYDQSEWPDNIPYWTFVFRSPDFGPLEFFAYVSPEKNIQFSRGQYSKKAALDLVMSTIAQQFSGVFNLQLNIPMTELELQMALLPQQNFGNALYAAIQTGITNLEFGPGFREHIRREILEETNETEKLNLQTHFNTGTLHLIPMDYRKQTIKGTAAFPVPEKYSLKILEDWYFGLEMPGSTDMQLLINTPRESNDGDSANSTGFYL